jgi:hypothetical protein
VIPTSTFVMAERLVSKVRMLMERKGPITIGMKWSKGGADFLASRLKVTPETCKNYQFAEGDVRHFDQGVAAALQKVYLDSMLVYENPRSRDYEMKKKLLSYIASRLVSRITHMFGSLWGIQIGGVPSGTFNTSHMDSFVMCLYYYFFCIHQLISLPEEQREQFEELILETALVVYGDDHVYNMTEKPNSGLLSAHLFAKFLKKCFDIELRDIYDRIPFVTTPYDGRVQERGICFLRHFMVLNPYSRRKGQPTFLPWRPTNEVIIRAVFGRETQHRDLIDVLFSILGHVYGTYASNTMTYEILRLMYGKIVSVLDLPEKEILDKVGIRITPDSVRKLRQMGVSTEEVLHGFPTLEYLIEKNKYDHDYHTEYNMPEFDAAAYIY